jgi:hypothetical protein
MSWLVFQQSHIQPFIIKLKAYCLQPKAYSLKPFTHYRQTRVECHTAVDI